MPHQLPTWEAAEAAVGIKEARQAHLPTPPSPRASVPFGFGDSLNPPPFVSFGRIGPSPVSAFGGSKLGYVFKLGALGLGYYLDGSTHVATSVRTPPLLGQLGPAYP